MSLELRERSRALHTRAADPVNRSNGLRLQKSTELRDKLGRETGSE